ncbi:MAG: isoleucine--tRNA ligase [Clostridia bacterium]|nr:isoleucine--tRNA ligase [Clostridia bacterium]MDY4083594.1 isoleucine--tRNA ligase [Eubacteriales bacterium]
MYNKVDSGMNFCQREKEVLEFWKANHIFEKSVAKNEGKEEFSFYDGPPTANGKPHIGHILTRVMKDIIPRYKTMKGYHVLRKAGWDTHGLPVELEVEKSLGIDGKQEIEKYGIEPFIKKCKESVWKYQSEWEKMSDRVGYWVDMDNPYVTYHDDYIESVWWALKQIADQGLIYKGHKIVPYCPRCGTALSSHEVAQGYKDVKEKSVFVKFKRKNNEGYFLAWTTTPWTLPSNVALCMNGQENYACIRANGEIYVLAEALVDSLFEEYEVIDVKKGSEYEREEYIPLFDCYNGREKAYYVTNDAYVTLTDGTGIVHIAPAFGEDDANVGRKYGLPFLQMVDDRGRFIEGVGEQFTGVFVKDGDKLVIEYLKEKGLLFKELMFEHSYPFCWRCDTPLLYYARSSWFIKMTAVRDKLLKNNATVNWMPPTIGTGRMGNFLENVIDWGFSRERYWGTPLPIWVCPDCGEIKVIGSRQELRELGGLDHDIELHRPYIDAVHFKCPKCGGTMNRTPEVLDCWFDSGSMPFAQLHYPFENKELFEKQFPANFISEAVDQTRGWFYTLLAISTLLFDKAPFKNCIVLGHVNDKNGIKMSKHKGNVVDPWSVLDVQGADAVRWYFYSSSAPWLPSRFSADNVSECQRKFMGTLWNAYSFFVLYADIDKYDPTKYNLKDCALTHMDKWILSGLNTLIDAVDKNLEQYKITESARMIEEFTDNLSNWYIRRGRERYWGKEMTEDKIAAYTTLYHVLVELSKLIAPMVPFMAESIYRNLVVNFDKTAPESVHLADYPVADYSMINKELEADMEFVLKAVALGRAARNKSNIKNRQPLSKLFILTDLTVNDEGVYSLVADEINVKSCSVVKDKSEFMTYELKPQLKTLGPKYGKSLGAIRNYLSTCANASEIVEKVNTGAQYCFEVNGETISLGLEDLLITPINKPGYALEVAGDMTVVIDTNLNDDLIKEGIARELTSKIQTMRKEAGFEVVDHIVIGYACDQEIADILTGDKSIADGVLCDGFNGELDGYVKDWDINGHKATLSVKKA